MKILSRFLVNINNFNQFVKDFTLNSGILTDSLTIYIIFQKINRNIERFEVNLRNFNWTLNEFIEIYIILTFL